MAKRKGRVPPARNPATSRPTSSEGRKVVDQLFSPRRPASFPKLAWIFPASLGRESRVKWIHSGCAAVHAEDTLMKAKSRAPIKARQRFIFGLLVISRGKARPFAWARRFKLVVRNRLG